MLTLASPGGSSVAVRQVRHAIMAPAVIFVLYLVVERIAPVPRSMVPCATRVVCSVVMMLCQMYLWSTTAVAAVASYGRYGCRMEFGNGDQRLPNNAVSVLST